MGGIYGQITYLEHLNLRLQTVFRFLKIRDKPYND